MTELDKFKRRMIRTVARLLLHEKQPEGQVWDALRKESGCDCKLLWQRMRALTIKKLDRLLAADDQPDMIAAVARLTPTDWLMCDLVLVHEDVDLIGSNRKGKPQIDAEEPQPLVDLFNLIQGHGIELVPNEINAKSCQLLAEAWTAATAFYNMTKYKGQRRQCSAMLLQRRWYQMKEATRTAFYRLWSNYRGNLRLWDQASKYQPTDLQIAIAKRYPHVVTHPFQHWDDQIDAGLVILPLGYDNRESKPLEVTEPCSSDGNEPDLMVLEPVIETIELDTSDSEEPNPDQIHDPGDEVEQIQVPECGNPNSNGSGVIQDDDDSYDHDSSVRNQQNIADGLSNVKILEATHIPIQNLTDDGPEPVIRVKIEPEDPHDPAVKRRNLSIEMSKFLESTSNEVDASEISAENIQIDDLGKEKADEYLSNSSDVNVNRLANDSDRTLEQVEEEIMTHDLTHLGQSNKTVSYEMPENVVDIMTPEESTQEKTAALLVRSVENVSDCLPEDVTDKITSEQPEQQLVRNKTSDEMLSHESASSNDDEVHIDNEAPNTSDELIKAKADEYVRNTKLDNQKPASPEEKTDSEEEDFFDDIIKQKADEFVREADQKKLASDISTGIETKTGNDLLEGMEIVDDGIEYIEDDDDLDIVIKTEPGCDVTTPEQLEDTPSFDLKLLMDPVVYTLKLDDMTVFTQIPFECVTDSVTIERALIESRPVSKKGTKDIQNVRVVSNESLISQSTVDTKLSQELPVNDSVSQELIFHENFSANDDSVSHDFSADGNDTSDDDISDDLKVKPSSYLLQKPRSRSYNPIQLCKNPDFNTRLRRLTVGFFTSSRNRQLLKACKPMTIDLHKAFENKLLNGVLYLKTDNVKLEKNDDAKTQPEYIQTASVVPSAMPIQSLIDNVVESYVEKQSSSITTVDLTIKSREEKEERNKVINLKDINEIRRINQKLLTAQVTPIRMQKNGDANSQTGQQNPPPSDQPHAVQIIGGDKAKEKTTDDDSNQAHNECQSKTTKEIPVFENPNKRLSRYKSSHLTSSFVVGIQQSCRKEHVPWNKPALLKNQKVDEFLITLDTLNKMIHKMIGSEPVTGKKQNWIVNRDKNISKQPKCDEKKEKTIPSEARVVTVKPKNQEKRKVCCWAREKLIKTELRKRTKLTHSCARLCTCCCREELLRVFSSFSTQRKKLLMDRHPTLATRMQETDAAMRESDTIQVHFADHQLANACEAIKEVSQNSCQNPPTPVIRVVDKLPCTERKLCALPPPSPSRGFPMQVSAIRSRQPILEYISITSRETSTRLVFDEPPEHHYISVQTTPVSRVTVATQTDEDTAVTLHKTTAGAHILHPQANLPKLTVKSPQQYPYIKNQIVIDGSASNYVPSIQVLKTAKAPQKSSEKMMFLSSNTLSQKAPGNPIYLGKNKILLTTVKFPKNINKSTPEIPSEQCASVIPSSLPLPAGVQLMMRANGELTYILDPGVMLDAVEMDSVNKIIEIVKTQINASDLLKTSRTVLSNEVIKLSDDENDPNDQSEPDIAKSSIESTNPITRTEALIPASLLCDEIVKSPDDESIPNEQPESDRAEASVAKTCTEYANPIIENLTPVLLSDEIVKLPDEGNVPSEQPESETAVASIAQTTTESTNPIIETLTPASLLSDGIVKLSYAGSIPNEQPESEAETAQISTESTNSIIETHTPESLLSNQIVTFSDDKNASNDETESGSAVASIVHMSIESTSQMTTTETPTSTTNDTVDVQTVGISAVQEPVNNEATEFDGSNGSGAIIAEAKNEASDIAASKEVTQDSNENNSRNLLMDLMEMSGISAEDTNPAPLEMSGTSAEDTNPAPLEELPVSVSNVNKLGPVFSAPAQADLPELSPVTSLAELKYACEQDGKFFKLDFTTGNLVRINVCIKKNPKVKKQSPSFYVTTPSVIDLTEEENENNSQTAKQDDSKNYTVPKIAPKNPGTGFSKNIDNLFRHIGRKPPHILMIKTSPSVTPTRRQKRKRNFLTVETNTDEGYKRVLRQRLSRKQNLNRIEAKIDMVDSDAPLEEEYLIDSDSGDDEFKPPPYFKYQNNRVSNTESIVTDKTDEVKMSDRSLLKPIHMQTSPVASVTNEEESSDDEPLAKKVKRREVYPSCSTAVPTNIVTDAITENPECPDNYDTEDHLPEIFEEDVNMDIDMENSFVPTFLENDLEDAEEDCILGV